MNLKDLAETSWTWLNEVAISPLAQFYRGLGEDERIVLYILLATAAALGFLAGRRRARHLRLRFQNRGEVAVSNHLCRHFRSPDYHLMNHVTLRMEDGTTQVDHILVSRFGVFVIETKHYSGWIFGSAGDKTWTQVHFSRRFRFQNPIFQNKRHVRAVQGLLDFLPPGAVKSVVVFSGKAQFKTEVPQGVVSIGELKDFLRNHGEEVISLNRMQFCVGRLETARLAISAETDVEHVESLARRHGSRTA